MKIFLFKSEIFVPKTPEEAFAFFSTAQNLNAVTPPWLHFEILTPTPVVMASGCRIDYRLRLYRIPIRWQTEITAWEPPVRFVDEQKKGPYRLWRHEHRFIPVPGGTRMTDQVEYAVPGWIFAPLVHRFLVKPDIERIFRFRETKFQEIFRNR